MINSKHPRERQRTSLAHEYGHVLIDRHKPGVDYFIHEGRKPANERFVEAFAMAFLIPASGVRRHFREIYNATGDFQVGDLIRLSSIFDVSVQSMTYRLEGLGLISKGTWDMLISAKFKVHEAKNQLELRVEEAATEPALPERYVLLAVHAFVRGMIGEGDLARYLRCDRIAAREIVAERAKHLEVSSDGTTELFDLPFAQSLVAQK
jgi:Zn-dependent peptidase ImmA (M78 family)